MTRERSVDERIGAWLLDSAPDQLPNRVLRATFERTRAGRQRRTVPGWGSILARRTTTAALAVGATAIALIVVGVILPPPTNPSLGGDAGQTPITSATLSATSPTLEPTATPSPTPTPILWTKASLQEDWPAPVRAEPAADAVVVQILVKEGVPGEYLDPSGDTESAVFPWVDIREVRLSAAPYLYIHPVSSPPRVDPTEQWIAYGVVFDENRDGVPDWRYGMDNRPVAKDDNQGIRAWRTDLHTGRTETAPPYYNGVAGVVLDTYWDYNDMGATFVFGGEVTGGGTAGKRMDVPFYVWASVIQDGRVIATDYAPDAGWLDPGSTP